MRPGFESRVVNTFPDGSQHVLNSLGVIVLQAPGATGIPSEIEQPFKGRPEWEKEYRHRFQSVAREVWPGTPLCGGMNKTVFAHDRAAIDAEIERLKPLIELGGYIPCPDHRIAPDATWDNIRYYCDRLREEAK